MSAAEARPGEVTFYVVRHGQTLFNVMNKVQGWCDTPLTAEGVAGAEALGRGLADVEFAAAFSSDSGRAVQTMNALLEARALARGELSDDLARFASLHDGGARPEAFDTLPFVTVFDPRLREWCYGDFEGESGALLHAVLDSGFGAPLSFEEHNRRLPEVADVIADADTSGRAERFDAIEARLRSFLGGVGRDLRAEGGGNVLVVTHSFVVRTLVYLLEPDRVNDPVKIPNVSVTRIGFDGEDFMLHEIGSTAWRS
ncbi:histidine phosphatase family protein [Arabiibacter massiliensis]|uniref:histidine phosphatase family protein n=1 Tax=Arabiibacter massiliensis TaxID=1870985 RepID=UPI0009B9D039|nr:histidine phosphatase family protein [Arabiibacter massiliensis]